MTDNTLLYVAIALAVLALAVYKYSKHREAKFQEKKQAHVRKKICEDTAIISNFQASFLLNHFNFLLLV